MKQPPKLTEEARVFVVQSLACFDSPTVVAAEVKKEFGIVISPQGCECYDPGKHAGRDLAKKWRTLFDRTREEFLKNTAKIGIANRAVRLRVLNRMAHKAESSGNMALTAQLLEQAAKDSGDVYTNKQNINLKGQLGVAVEVVRFSDDAAPAPSAPAQSQ